jgi:hypothetical protein
VGNFVRAGTRGLRVAVRANCPVRSVSCSTPPSVTNPPTRLIDFAVHVLSFRRWRPAIANRAPSIWPLIARKKRLSGVPLRPQGVW